MASTDNQILVSAPFDLVWEMTNDVESWPELFTEYESVEVLERHGDTIRFRLTLRPDEQGVRWSWVSERTSDPQTRTVRAHRIETGPFEYMNIFWEYETVGSSVRMRWVQDFRVREGLPFGDAEMVDRLNTNTRREMAHIKARVEATARDRHAAAAGAGR